MNHLFCTPAYHQVGMESKPRIFLVQSDGSGSEMLHETEVLAQVHAMSLRSTVEVYEYSPFDDENATGIHLVEKVNRVRSLLQQVTHPLYVERKV